MKNISFLLPIVLLFLPFLSNAQVADAASATADSELLLEEVNVQNEINETEMRAALEEHISNLPAKAQEKIRSTQAEDNAKLSAKKARKMERAKKFLNSKTGKWLVKRAIKKAEKKRLRQELKKVKGDKEAKRILKEESEQRAKMMNSNIRLGLILLLVGIILTLLPGSIFALLGTIVIIIGLVFIILGLV